MSDARLHLHVVIPARHYRDEASFLRNTNHGHKSKASKSRRRQERPGKIADHSHSIINEARKSTWLKGFAVIDMGLYRRFYRQENMLFSGAGCGTICGAPTHHQSASIIPNRRQDFRLFCTALQGIACVSTRLCCQLVGTP